MLLSTSPYNDIAATVIVFAIFAATDILRGIYLDIYRVRALWRAYSSGNLQRELLTWRTTLIEKLKTTWLLLTPDSTTAFGSISGCLEGIKASRNEGMGYDKQRFPSNNSLFSKRKTNNKATMYDI